ncbi:hypothetical protein Tco_0868669 [Tanacetum coccineum]
MMEEVSSQKQSFDRVLKGRTTITPLFQAMRGLSPQRKSVIREMGFGDIIDFPIVEIPTKLAFYVVDILNTRKMTLECPAGDIVITPKTVREVLGVPMGRRKLEREYNDAFLLEWKDQFKNVNKITIKALSDLLIDTKNKESIESILIDKAEIEEKINENLFENDERLIQLKERMKEIFKEPYIPKYDTSSSNESDDDNDDNSQVGDENEESYGTQTASVEEDHIQIETTCSDDEIIKDDNAEFSEKKDGQEAGRSKKEDGDTTKEEAMENTKATNQKNIVEIGPSNEPFVDSEIFKEFLKNEHLYVNTQKIAENKEDKKEKAEYECLFENKDENMKKAQVHYAEEREKHMKEKEKEKQDKRKNISSSKDSRVFGTQSWKQGSHPSFDLGPSLKYMELLDEVENTMLGITVKFVGALEQFEAAVQHYLCSQA